MTEFDKIINNNFREFDNRMDRVCINRDELELICRMYAIEMCRLQRESCADNAETKDVGNYYSLYVIDKSTIINAELPTELQ